MSNTEVNQINILIQNKKDEIAALEEQRTQFENDEYETPQASAEVAQDEDASRDERAAAAVATTGQDPAQVFAEQSPTTPPEAAADEASQRDPDEVQAEAKQESEEAKQENAEDADKVSEETTSQDVKLPDGRGNPNELGDQAASVAEEGEAQVEAVSPQVDETTSDDKSESGKKSKKGSSKKS